MSPSATIRDTAHPASLDGREGKSWQRSRGKGVCFHCSSRVFVWPCIVFFWLAAVRTLLAHDPGLSTATVQVKANKLEAVLVFSVIDATQLLDSEQSRGTQLPREQQEPAAAELKQKALQALKVEFDGEEVKVIETRCRFDESGNASVYILFPARRFSKLVIRSEWLALLPPGHRQFMSIERADGVVLAEELLSASSNSVTIQNERGSKKEPAAAAHNSFADFLLMGVRHIWTGYDHLLFLFGLLLVTRNFSSSIKIITCFTIAHSITLAVATLSLVRISSRLVEPLIAASIIYVGIENLLRGDDPKGRWLLTFAFGLIHGFGFASVLRELGVGANGRGITMPLVSFNLGVEIGQTVVAVLVLPVIWKFRANPIFVRRWVPLGSLAVALTGSYWFIERVWW
jgi:hydrogenase/urease accessory protein HupE